MCCQWRCRTVCADYEFTFKVIQTSTTSREATGGSSMPSARTCNTGRWRLGGSPWFCALPSGARPAGETLTARKQRFSGLTASALLRIHIRTYDQINACIKINALIYRMSNHMPHRLWGARQARNRCFCHLTWGGTKKSRETQSLSVQKIVPGFEALSWRSVLAC